MSRGWEHYEIHRPEPHVLLFRRPIGTDPHTGNPSSYKILTIATIPSTQGDSFTWTIPARRMRSAVRGARFESKTFRMQSLSGAFRLRYYPKGMASTSMCSAFIWAEHTAPLQMLLCVNNECKYFDSDGSDGQVICGLKDFCLQPEGDVVLKFVTFNLHVSCTNMAGEEVANFKCKPDVSSHSLYDRIAALVGIAPRSLKLISLDGELLPTSNRQPLLAGLAKTVFSSSQKGMLFQIGERVECRDGTARWKRGIVQSACPLKIQPDGYKAAYGYGEVRKIEESHEAIMSNISAIGESPKPILQIQRRFSATPNVVPLRTDRQKITKITLMYGHPTLMAHSHVSNGRPRDMISQDHVVETREQYFEDETKSLPNKNYMKMQVDINEKMRCILIDWMIDVVLKYHLDHSTLHLSVHLIDRYLSKTTVMRKRLQLVGITAMFIASKFSLIASQDLPRVRDWVYITDHAYEQDEVHHMECHMLYVLDFRVMAPTAAQFFDFLQEANSCDDVHRALAQYILELGLLQIRMLEYTPSHVAASAILLSNRYMRRQPLWPDVMCQESRHSESALSECVEVFKELHEASRGGSGGKLAAVYKKFSRQAYHSVAKLSFGE